MQKQAIFQAKLLPYALVAPQLAIVLIFFYWPALQAVIQSFLLQDAFGLSTTFVWFENYLELFKEPAYFEAIVRTFFFSFAIAGGLLAPCAIGYFASFWGVRVVMGLPLAGSAIVFLLLLLIWLGVLWIFMLHPSLGVLSRYLRAMGIDWNPLLDGNQAATLIILAAAWKQISYNFLFFLAGLQSIPKSVLEAAAIDGARPMRRFWTVTFPLLSPTIFFLLVVNIVYAFFDTFGIIDTMTRGGPGTSTVTLVYKVYSDGLLGGNLGSSAAQSVILMVLVIVLTGIQFRFVERKVTY